MNFRNAVLKSKPQPVAAAQKEVVVYLRKIPQDNNTDTDQNGQQKQKYTYDAATCGDLVDFAGEKLGPTWGALGISEDPTLVVLEAEQGTNGNNVVQKRHDEPVQTRKVYTILECWTKTPLPFFSALFQSKI